MKNLVAVLFSLVVVACNTVQPAFKPVEHDSQKQHSSDQQPTLVDLKQGFNLYVTNCAGCHWLPVPSEKKKEEWEDIFQVMFPKTQLTTNEQVLIRQYIYSKL